MKYKARNEMMKSPCWSKFYWANPDQAYRKYLFEDTASNPVLHFWKNYRDYLDDSITHKDYILMEYILCD